MSTGGGEVPSPRGSVFAAASPGASQRASRDESPPTLALRVTGASCYVRVETSAGGVLVDDTLTRGQRFSTDKPDLDVTVGDAGAVDVFVNGQRRAQSGGEGVDTFKVSREN